MQERRLEPVRSTRQVIKEVKRHILFAVMLVVLSGCFPGQDAVHQLSTDRLCVEYWKRPANDLAGGVTYINSVRQELRERGAMTDSDWAAADAKVPTFGVNKCVILATFGQIPIADGNTKGPRGEEIETIVGPGYSATFVNGKATMFTKPTQ